MKKLFVLLALLVGLTFTGAKVWAADKPTQDPDYEDAPTAITVSDLEILSNKIGDLSKYAKVSVLLQAQYINGGQAPGAPGLPKGFSHPVPTPAAGFPKYNDVFTGKRAEISFFGDLVDKKIAYRVQWDPLGTTSAKVGVSNGEQVKDYWIRFSYLPFADIQFGQFKFAQALEGRTPTGELDFYNTTFITTALESRRDLALQVSGTKIAIPGVAGWTLEYAGALVKGSGQNAAENNDHKDFAGRLGLNLTDLGIWIGASGYSGFETSVVGLTNRGYRDNLGYELRFVKDAFKLQGEFIQGHLEAGNNYNPSGTLASRPTGFYVTAQYRYQDLRLGVRGESYDSNVGKAKTAGGGNWNNDILTVGLDWFQAKDKFRIGVNYENHLRQYQVVIGQVQVNI